MAVMDEIERKWTLKYVDYIKQLSSLGHDFPMMTISINQNISTEYIIANSHDNEIIFWPLIQLNPNFMPEILLKMMENDIQINWDIASTHTNITTDFILEHLDFPWWWEDEIVHNPNINMAFINAIHHRFPEVFDQLSKANIARNKNITMKDIRENPLPRYWLSQNPNMEIEYVIANPSSHWNWTHLSKNPGIDIAKNPELPWRYYDASYNPKLSISFVIDNHDKKWDWVQITRHKNTRLQDILDNPDLPWDKFSLPENPNFNICWIKHFPNIYMNWKIISMHKNIIMDDIISNPQLPWNNHYVSKNPNLTMDYVLSQLKTGLCWDYVSGCSNITPQEILDNHTLPWNWHFVCCNTFTRAKRDFIVGEIRRHMAAWRIQNTWRNAIVDPYCRIGINTVRRHYEEYAAGPSI